MTIRQTSDVLGLKVRTIREWIKTGRLDAMKRGNRWHVLDEIVYSKEVQERADKGREHSRRIKEGKSMGVLAGGSQDTEKSV